MEMIPERRGHFAGRTEETCPSTVELVEIRVFPFSSTTGVAMSALKRSLTREYFDERGVSISRIRTVPSGIPFLPPRIGGVPSRLRVGGRSRRDCAAI
jgi:hypothetical protein